MALTSKNQAAVALGRKGGKKGGPARAARLTPEERSESARKAVLARWAKARADESATKPVVLTRKKVSRSNEPLSLSKKSLDLCLRRLKNAKGESEIRRLTEELQRIVFHKQYANAKN